MHLIKHNLGKYEAPTCFDTLPVQHANLGCPHWKELCFIGAFFG